MATKQAYFGPGLFDFLRQLRRNNNRDWFQANKARYERDVRGPALRFIEDVGPRLRQISRHLVADPRPVGGSLFRIHRDIRFSASDMIAAGWDRRLVSTFTSSRANRLPEAACTCPTVPP